MKLTFPAQLDPDHPISLWLAECCELGAHFEASSAELGQSWTEWTEREDWMHWSKLRFFRLLHSIGFHRRRGTGGSAMCVGLKLKRTN